jgi:hypothetical protein
MIRDRRQNLAQIPPKCSLDFSRKKLFLGSFAEILTEKRVFGRPCPPTLGWHSHRSGTGLPRFRLGQPLYQPIVFDGQV